MRVASSFTLAALLPVVVATLAGCSNAPASEHLSLSSVESLRSAFNADSGKVRAIFLASPT